MLLLAFTAIAAAIVAYNGIEVLLYGPFLLSLAAVVLGAGGCEAITAYTDRDIDGIMERTRGRPVPSGALDERVPLVLGISMVAVGCALAYMSGPLVLLLLVIAVVDNVFVYSIWLKRRSRWNVLLGGVCGGIPVLMGWAAVTHTVSPTSLFLAAVVIVWIPLHIWSFSIEHREDYNKAAVPMFPLTLSGRKSLLAVGWAGVLIAVFPLLAYVTGVKSYLFLAVALLMGLMAVALSARLILNPVRNNARHVFIYSNFYLFGIFLALMLTYA